MSSTYIDCFQYKLMPVGLMLSNAIGNQFRFAVQQAAGTTTLTVPSSAVQIQLNAYDYIYIFDGPNSEMLQVASVTLIGATSIPLVSATQYVHNTGVAVCSDGTSGVTGSLAQQIFTASEWVEDICHQALWNTTYTGEILTMPTMRAAVDNQENIHFRPRHFPITALSAISVQMNTSNIVPYDPLKAIIDSDQQTVDIPVGAVLTSQQQQQTSQGYPRRRLNRRSNAWITLTYTAGMVPGQLRLPVLRACSLLTSECFAQLENPIGADQIQQNKRNVTFTLRGDQSGESLLVKQATKLLAPYTMQAF